MVKGGFTGKTVRLSNSPIAKSKNQSNIFYRLDFAELAAELKNPD
jgi:hypothetical protein